MVRLKSRYLLFDVIYPKTTEQLPSYSRSGSLLQLHSASQNITVRLLAEIVKRNIKILFGDQGSGSAASSMIVKYFSQKTSTGIIRCSREYHNLVCAALTMIKEVNGINCIVRVIRISGTIKKCEQAAGERNRMLMRILDNDAFEDEEILKLEDVTRD